jgi:large subunit ribosomal protein L22
MEMEARAIQRMVRQSPRKMRLVVDLIRGRAVPEAYAILRFSKKLAARQIHKVLKSAVANAEQQAQRANRPLDVDHLRVKYAVINAGQTLKRFTSGAMGRATPILKRTSHVEIHVAEDMAAAPVPATAGPAAGAAPAPARPRKRAAAKGGTAKRGAKAKKGGAKRARRPAKKGSE